MDADADYTSSGRIHGLDLIARALGQNRLSHAYLLTGPHGSGKRRMIEECAQFLLCMNPDTSGPVPAPCLSCSSCRKFQRRVHPDLLKIEPAGRLIKIDQIRKMQKMLTFAPLESERRVCAVISAERLNIDASNALLKTLEEPPANTHLLLAATSASRLLPTIVSRCQILPVNNQGGTTDFEERLIRASISEEVLPFLRCVSGNSPQFAQTLADQGILEVREAVFEFLCSPRQKSLFFSTSLLLSHPRERIQLSVMVFNTIIRDLILIMNIGNPGHELMANLDKAAYLADLAQRINYDSLFRYKKLVEKAERYIDRNVNPEMISDMLLAFWLKSGAVN